MEHENSFKYVQGVKWFGFEGLAGSKIRETG